MTASNNNVKESKIKADEFYRNKDYQQAIKFYSIAIENASSEDDNLHLYYSNRCACYLQTNSTQSAIEDAESIVSIKPTWSKGYCRLGTCQMKLNKGQQAIHSLQKAVELDSRNSEASRLLNDCYRKYGGGDTSNDGGFGNTNFNFNDIFNNTSGGGIINKIKVLVTNLIMKLIQFWTDLSSEHKKYLSIGVPLLLGLYYMFSFRSGYNDGYGYDDYYSGSSYRSRSTGISWTTWGAIMMAAYKLPPMFPDQLGDRARPFFGLNMTTFMWLLRMISGSGMGGMGGMGGRRRRY